jgi:small-conductance mechanosensitive channel
VVVESLGESEVKLQVRVWIKNARKEREIFFKTNEIVKNALQAGNIEIPYPHMKVLLDK